MADKSTGEILGEKISRRAALRNISLLGVGLPIVQIVGETELHPQMSESSQEELWLPSRRFLFASVTAGGSRCGASWQNRSGTWTRCSAPSNGDSRLSSVPGANWRPRRIVPRSILARESRPSLYLPLPGRAATKVSGRSGSPSWTADGKLVINDGEGSKPVVEQLKSLGLNKAPGRASVSPSLPAVASIREGMVSATYLDNLRFALPGVVFLPVEKWGSDGGPSMSRRW